jgi:hypothetical protein
MVNGVDELSAFVWGDEKNETREEDAKDNEILEQDGDKQDSKRPRSKAWTSERMRRVM